MEAALSRDKENECRDIIDDLEDKYLGEYIRHIPYDKYFRMLARGMTEKEAKKYTKAKLYLIKKYHN